LTTSEPEAHSRFQDLEKYRLSSLIRAEQKIIKYLLSFSWALADQSITGIRAEQKITKYLLSFSWVLADQSIAGVRAEQKIIKYLLSSSWALADRSITGVRAEQKIIKCFSFSLPFGILKRII